MYIVLFVILLQWHRFLPRCRSGGISASWNVHQAGWAHFQLWRAEFFHLAAAGSLDVYCHIQRSDWTQGTNEVRFWSNKDENVIDCRLVTGIMTVTVIIIICEIPEVQEVFRDFRINCDKWFGVKLLIVVVHVCRELLLWFLSCLLHHWIFIPFLPEETNTCHINLGTYTLIKLNVCVI